MLKITGLLQLLLLMNMLTAVQHYRSAIQTKPGIAKGNTTSFTDVQYGACSHIAAASPSGTGV